LIHFKRYLNQKTGEKTKKSVKSKFALATAAFGGGDPKTKKNQSPLVV
jgi:hypothetical protein